MGVWCLLPRSKLFHGVPDNPPSPILGVKYRSDVSIIGDILHAASEGGRDGVIISTISRKANLTHCITVQKCERLASAGLIESSRVGRNRVFALTSRGIEFFGHLRAFQSMMEGLGL